MAKPDHPGVSRMGGGGGGEGLRNLCKCANKSTHACKTTAKHPLQQMFEFENDKNLFTEFEMNILIGRQINSGSQCIADACTNQLKREIFHMDDVLEGTD